MLVCTRFLKNLFTTKRATNTPKKAFLASSASASSHQIPVTNTLTTQVFLYLQGTNSFIDHCLT